MSRAAICLHQGGSSGLAGGSYAAGFVQAGVEFFFGNGVAATDDHIGDSILLVKYRRSTPIR